MVIESLNIPTEMVAECKDKADFVKTYSGHWWNFDDEKLATVYDLVMGEVAPKEKPAKQK